VLEGVPRFRLESFHEISFEESSNLLWSDGCINGSSKISGFSYLPQLLSLELPGA
jgi:hypothetical protein